MRQVVEQAAPAAPGTAAARPSRPRDAYPPSRFQVPTVPDGLVRRERLLHRVSSGVQGPLTLVSAAAGSGKTSLLASWAADRAIPGPLVWMRLQEGDEHPDAFWSSLARGLTVGDAALSGLPLPDLPGPAGATGTTAPPGPADRAVLDMLAWWLTDAGGRTVLVLDDAEYLADRALGDGLGYLLRHSGEHLHVVLLTRTEPCLPLHRYRLDGDVTEIRQADLALTDHEAVALLEAAQVDLAQVELTDLMERTHGWVAGVRFAARELAGRPRVGSGHAGPGASTSESGGVEAEVGVGVRDDEPTDGALTAYLRAEVLDAQPAELREAMLRCGVVDVLEAGLVDALVDGAHGQQVIDRLTASGALLDADPDRRGSFRFQPQLRDLLRAQLSEESPETVATGHRRAAQWFAAQGRSGAAISHAVRAGAWDLAAAVAVDGLDAAAALAGRVEPHLRVLLDGLPDDVRGAESALVRATAARLADDGELVARELRRARAGVRVPEERRFDASLLTLALLEAEQATRAGDGHGAAAALSTAERRLRRTSGGTPGHRSAVGRLLAVQRCELDLLRCELADVAVAAADLERVPQGQATALRRRARAAAALSWSLTGQLRRAAAAARLALDARPGDDRWASVRALLALAWVATEEYDLDGAGTLAAEASRLGAEGDAVCAVVLALVRGRVVHARGDDCAAQQHVRLARSGRGSRTLPAPWEDRLVAAQARWGAPGRRTGGPAGEPPVVAVLTLDARLDLLVRRAERAERAGDRDRARLLLDRALRLAEPELIRRPFLEAPATVRRMLPVRTSAPTAWLAVPAGRTDAGTRGHPADLGGQGVRRPGSQHLRREALGRPVAVRTGSWGPPSGRRPAPEHLTAKELQVLEHLGRLLTTAEIADTMYVSVNTVRTHVRNILRKLDVARRHEAVRRAWELGLLGPPGQADAGPARGPGSGAEDR
ncbi:LuxR C-terminal-related transcriptional regulator [Cellulomonas soli]|uniref:HTH luxR-type domain-containing protein n=1 Tax=Cellulomonas soli TaxID=931535 RepID=A0A512PDX4_9CELL|nr:LuxR C-terminal-related transcriptional regulator [Cellulomonas soli]NYI60001.1 LuxR family maltose regulon positive regulatory protein [Cellulomonas soli]GEP69346.1 hypothetical protein CSO01_20610 [Cellulomonas soli]